MSTEGIPGAEEQALLSELHHLNETWNQAWFRKDAATVERFAAEDYVYVAPNGFILDRAAILRIIRSPSYRLDHGGNTEVIVRLLGREAALIRRRWQGGGSFEGTAFTDDQRCVMVWARKDGEWQVVFEQCSFSSLPAPRSGAE
jgi:ketosteroid isomerase-like protein